MSASPWPRKLHVRSLNDLSRSHLLTYVGARLLAESIHPSHIEEWTNSYVLRKASTHRRQVYWKHSLFKGFDDGGNFEYRKCVIGSPTTQLTEIWLLDRLSREKQFVLQPYVYSYGLSGQQSSHAYKYYYRGYKTRENGIAEAASKIKEAHVVVFDLRRFYPSINVQRLRRRFNDLIAATTMTKEERETAIQCVAELTNIKNETGLPIGPPLSHALANVFLSDFDSQLSEKYPGRYFRYVDDVAIVTSPSEVDEAKLFFEEVAKGEGLNVNPGKLYVVPGELWQNQLDRREMNGAEEFGLFLSDLRRYLAHNPEDFEKLKSDFQSEGFTLPFTRLRSVALSSNPYRRLLKRLFDWSFGDEIPRPSELMKRALRIRANLVAGLGQSMNEREFALDGMLRRWQIQNLRSFINRSLYLLAEDDKSALLKAVPDLRELRPTKTVLEALVTTDASALTKYPGPTVTAFCELWLENRREKPKFDWSSKPMKEERDSVCVIAMYGLCSPPEAWTENLSEESSRLMVNLSARRSPTRRNFDEFSYVDEMQSLFLKRDIDFERILTTRFDDGEDIVLPALSLGENQYLS